MPIHGCKIDLVVYNVAIVRPFKSNRYPSVPASELDCVSLLEPGNPYVIAI